MSIDPIRGTGPIVATATDRKCQQALRPLSRIPADSIPPFGGGRILRQQMRRPQRARAEAAAAVRTATMQHAVGAGLAERAFETADHRIGGIRRQVPVAAFAVGAELEHGCLLTDGGQRDDARITNGKRRETPSWDFPASDTAGERCRGAVRVWGPGPPACDPSRAVYATEKCAGGEPSTDEVGRPASSAVN